MDFKLIANFDIMLPVNSGFLKGFAMAKESLFQVRVICYQGYRGEETPRRFYLGERQVEVAEIVDRWICRHQIPLTAMSATASVGR